MNRVRRSATKSSLLAVLLLAGLALRGLIPAGWMPVVSENRITLTWCDGFVPQRPPEPAHGEHHAGAHHSPAKEKPSGHGANSPLVCAFAAMAMAAPDLAQAPLPEAPLVWAEWHAPAPTTIGRGLAAPPPPATGPPELT